jgi:hypothetical protein
MTYEVTPHKTELGQYYVNDELVAGATNEKDAIRIYLEARNSSDP